MTIITYIGSFKYIAPVFLDKEQKQYRKVATTPSTSNFDSLPYPLPQGRVVIFLCR